MPKAPSKKTLKMCDILLKERAEFGDNLSKRLESRPESVNYFFRTIQKYHKLKPETYPLIKKFKYHAEKSFTIYYINNGEKVVYEKSLERFPSLEYKCKSIWVPLFGKNVKKVKKTGKKEIIKKRWKAYA